MKKNILSIINITILLLFFSLAYIYNHSSFLCGHDYFLPFEFNLFDLRAPRVPALFLNYLYSTKLPAIFGMHPIDFRTNIFVSSVCSFLYICIIYLFSKIFYIFNQKNRNITFKSILQKKENIIIFPICFFLLDISVFSYLLKSPEAFEEACFHMFDIAEYLEHNACYIVLFPLIYIISDILINNKKIKKKELLLYSFIGFLTGFWCEIINLITFIALFSILIIMYFYDKERIKKHSIISIYLSFLFGVILVYFVFGHFNLNNVGSLGEYNILSNLPKNLANIDNFLHTFININIINKVYYWCVFLFLLVLACIIQFCNKKQDFVLYKKINIAIIIILSIFFSLLISNFLFIFISHARFEQGYLFERVQFQQIFINILSYLIIFILGIIYYQNNKLINYILCFALSIFLIFSSIIFTNNYTELINIRYNSKKLVQEIEEKIVIYSSLKEAAILPTSIIEKTNNFTFWRYLPISIGYNFTNEEEGYPTTLKENYIDGIFLNQYTPYFNFNYKNSIVGIIFTDDNYAEEQYKIRKSLYNIENADSSLRFSEIKEYDYFPKIEKKGNKQINNNYFLKYQAIINHQAGNIEKAEQFYKKYLDNNPNDYDAMLKLGSLYEETKNFNKAINIYTKLYILNKNNLTFISKLSNAYFRNKNYEKALELNSKLLKLENEMLNLYINQVIIYKVLNDHIKLQEFISNTKETNTQYGKEISNFLNNHKNDNFKEYKLFAPV